MVFFPHSNPVLSLLNICTLSVNRRFAWQPSCRPVLLVRGVCTKGFPPVEQENCPTRWLSCRVLTGWKFTSNEPTYWFKCMRLSCTRARLSDTSFWLGFVFLIFSWKSILLAELSIILKIASKGSGKWEAYSSSPQVLIHKWSYMYTGRWRLCINASSEGLGFASLG